METCQPINKPYELRTHRGLPFIWGKSTLEQRLNFSLTTEIGDIDLLGEVTGQGTYARLVTNSEQMELFGIPIQVVALNDLIWLKRAAGRPKDLEVIAELESILDEQWT